MPPQNSDDIRGRMRAHSAQGSKPPLIDDFRAGQQRHFPSVGKTLPLRVPSARGHDPRPRQPLPRTPDGRISTPALPGPEQVPAVAPGPIAPALPAKAKSRKRRIFTKKRIILLALMLIVGAAGVFTYRALSNLQQVFHGSIFSVLQTTKLRGEDTGRVNILLAGNSADDPFHDGANLTDSIMIASIDVKHHSAFMISVPRDLWVDIPGFGHAKINEAYYDGQSTNFAESGYAPKGMGLLEKVVYQSLGVKANYYALVNYSAMRDAVDAVGGVDFKVTSDDPRGLYDPSIDFKTHGPLVNLSNGVHHLNGTQALDLARARGDSYGSYGFPRSDFDRTEHQRELIVAIKSKVLSAGTFANPIALDKLFGSVGRNVRTDFSLSEVHRLYDIGKDIKNTDIQSIGLNDVHGTNYLANYTSPRGASALIPAAGMDDFSAIQGFIRRLLASNPVIREGAEVVALNATSSSGVAAKAQTQLIAKGLTVSAIGDANGTQATTTIIDNSKGTMPATLALLKQLYGQHVTTSNPYAGVYTADFIVVLGRDQITKPATAP